jgi:hypothetical protein
MGLFLRACAVREIDANLLLVTGRRSSLDLNPRALAATYVIGLRIPT